MVAMLCPRVTEYLSYNIYLIRHDARQLNSRTHLIITGPTRVRPSSVKLINPPLQEVLLIGESASQSILMEEEGRRCRMSIHGAMVVGVNWV